MKREEKSKFESTLSIHFKIFFVVIADEGGKVRLTALGSNSLFLTIRYLSGRRSKIGTSINSYMKRKRHQGCYVTN